MLLPLLADSAGSGSSRLGGIVQRGLRIVRQVLHGEKPRSSPRAPDQSLVKKFPQIQKSSQVVPSNVVSVFRQRTQGILSNFLARNQIQTIAGEMRRRYGFRFMSGSAGLSAGPVNRVAVFGFVGLALHITRNFAEEADSQETFIQKPFEQVEVPAISHSASAEEEASNSAGTQYVNFDEDTDVTVIDEDEDSDFEVLLPAEVIVFAETVTDISDFGFSKDEAELKELIDLEIQQSMQLCFLMKQMSKENADLKKINQSLIIKENLLRKELEEMNELTKKQEQELMNLRSMLQQQNLMIKDALQKTDITLASSSSVKGGSSSNPVSSRTMARCGQPRRSSCDKENSSSEIDMERLRAQGGRVRELKIHRKQRLKYN